MSCHERVRLECDSSSCWVEEKGFEELCCQLAEAELPAGTSFTRTGAPDAGVECYAVHPDGTEWGWQAKYFLSALGDKQWSQIDKSVQTAIEKHGRLARYYVCVPQDRPDARIDGQRSAMERWAEHVQKWIGWATKRRRRVEFVYWGSYEILTRLARPEHVGRFRFWFDERGFAEVWFSARLDEALETAGPRYTPEIHVALPIAAAFEAFGRTERFFDRIKGRARDIRKRLQAFEHTDNRAADAVQDVFVSDFVVLVQKVLADLGAISVQPIEELPFQRIVGHVSAAVTAVEEIKRVLLEREMEEQSRHAAPGASATSTRANSFRDRRYRLEALEAELRDTHGALVHAESVAGRSTLLLTGDAGPGKTHLLCDVARARTGEGRPTVLLMGQRFVSTDEPWTQALQHLDLQGLSAEEFVGALQAAAQAAGCRALVMVDAMNEGAGRHIWPSHLPAFLAQFVRSPWIGVVLAVRSSYEEIVVPTPVRASAVTVTHRGFAEHEYDAARTFFVHYGLELPSTPLLAPEFRNPLFLKTLCCGLQGRGERRLPRGVHGITATFELFLGAINDRLASALGFNPKRRFVGAALEAFAKALIDSRKRWLPLAKAEEILNALLPGREFERSLYRGLVAEGVLVEDAWGKDVAREEVVFIGYERFADHLIVKALLDAHLDMQAPAAAFGAGGRLAYLADKKHVVAPGLLEAFFVQIPERTGEELIALAPEVMDRSGVGDAFRQSLVWRAPEAFSESTRASLNKLLRSEHDWKDTFDVLLTVATLPGHPFNATFLDRWLRRNPMPDRDARWSIYLHHAWRTHGAVDRLVDWASCVASNDTLDDEMVDLCSTALSWMLTTANRFLRDRATKALVSLLTRRLGAMARLVERFADIDDPYVAERIYAVAYGTAMRSYDPTDLSVLASCVYARVFEKGAVPVHILLRDYARGVIERALYLGAKIDVEPQRIRPPYESVWPTIPTDEDIKPLLPDWSHGSHDSRDIDRARCMISISVMDDDFARYVIGTNLSPIVSLPPTRQDRMLRSLTYDADHLVFSIF